MNKFWHFKQFHFISPNEITIKYCIKFASVHEKRFVAQVLIERYVFATHRSCFFFYLLVTEQLDLFIFYVISMGIFSCCLVCLFLCFIFVRFANSVIVFFISYLFSTRCVKHEHNRYHQFIVPYFHGNLDLL